MKIRKLCLVKGCLYWYTWTGVGSFHCFERITLRKKKKFFACFNPESFTYFEAREELTKCLSDERESSKQ